MKRRKAEKETENELPDYGWCICCRLKLQRKLLIVCHPSGNVGDGFRCRGCGCEVEKL